MGIVSKLFGYFLRYSTSWALTFVQAQQRRDNDFPGWTVAGGVSVAFGRINAKIRAASGWLAGDLRWEPSRLGATTGFCLFLMCTSTYTHASRY